MEIIINSVLAEMQPILKASQLKRLKDALDRAFEPKQNETNETLLRTFLTAKEVEGCSSKTLQYYDDTLVRALAMIGKPIGAIESDDLRRYLNDYETTRHYVQFLFLVGRRRLHRQEPCSTDSSS